MEYQIKTINTKEQISECNLFEISNYMWRNLMQPKAYGRMGYVKGQGFFIQMTCEESDPTRTFTKFWDPVYQDSAMEAFLAFPEEGEALTNDVMYTNFEVNSNAAMYIAYGKGRRGRQHVPEKYIPVIDCQCSIKADKWTVSFLIPETYLLTECGVKELNHETQIYCNFYKIAENKEIEHYGSFSKIESETPNFHMPVCFARAVIVD